jgi:hypothetical protein
MGLNQDGGSQSWLAKPAHACTHKFLSRVGDHPLLFA